MSPSHQRSASEGGEGNCIKERYADRRPSIRYQARAGISESPSSRTRLIEKTFVS